VAPDAEEGVLDDILGESAVGGDAKGDGVSHDTVAVVELLEGIELSGGDEGEDGPIGVVGRRRRASTLAGLALGHRWMRASGRFGSPGASLSSNGSATRRRQQDTTA